MLSTLSLADKSLSNLSDSSSSVVAPTPSSNQPQHRNTAPSLGSTPHHHQQLLYLDKENVSPHHSKWNTGTIAYPHRHSGDTSGHQHGDGSLVVFPDKQTVTSKTPLSSPSPSVPSPSTQELLKQQELQLRVLQEQVSVVIHDF